MSEKKVGMKTRFSFSNKEYKIVEQLHNPQMTMWWEKKKDICPHCKEIISRGGNYILNRIDIYIPSSKEIDNCTFKDIICCAKTNENTYLLLTKEKTKEALIKSENFSTLIETK